MDTTRSADGTTIAYERTGSGPALVLVVGAMCDRHTTEPLAALLGGHFTVFEYDRRGRGDSGDTLPYAVEREVEDLAAVLDAAGGAAGVYGHSSGAVLALEAAARGLGVTRVMGYEPPYTAGDEDDDLLARITAHVAAGRRARAVETFMLAVGLPPDALPSVRSNPDFARLESIAHTLAYDLTVSDEQVPVDRFAGIAVPTMLVDGAESPPWAAASADQVAAAVPGAERRTIAGEGHGVAHEAIAPAIVEFFS